jgi:hypothetical protein
LLPCILSAQHSCVAEGEKSLEDLALNHKSTAAYSTCTVTTAQWAHYARGWSVDPSYCPFLPPAGCRLAITARGAAGNQLIYLKRFKIFQIWKRRAGLCESP